ncbi:unnamed protein product [Lupinus luteus]|uniref:Uncharacterized protein n=1 Tax=Lupinus luteus TaxID=3873 RepID=A0AAV1X6M2_LUPLU
MAVCLQCVLPLASLQQPLQGIQIAICLQHFLSVVFLRKLLKRIQRAALLQQAPPISSLQQSEREFIGKLFFTMFRFKNSPLGCIPGEIQAIPCVKPRILSYLISQLG